MADGTDYGKIIILTGAGASAALRFPTMAEFPELFASEGYEDLKAFADGMHWRERCEDLEYIYDRLELYAEAGRRAAEGDLTLREALGGFDAAATLGARATAALSQLEELILEHLGEVKPGLEADLDLYRDALLDLQRMNSSPLLVFTTNYDLTLESLLPGNMIVDGFRYSERLRQRIWSARDAYRDGLRASATRLVVYRLGGCSCWFLDEQSGRIACLRPIPKRRDGLRPVVLQPARGKVGEAFRRPFAYAYSALREAMESARVCVVIGYSLRDDSVVDALNQTTSSGNLMFIVVDPAMDRLSISNALPGRMLRHIRGKWGDPNVNRCVLCSCERFLQAEDEEAREVEDYQWSVVPRDSCGGCCSGCWDGLPPLSRPMY